MLLNRATVEAEENEEAEERRVPSSVCRLSEQYCHLKIFGESTVGGSEYLDKRGGRQDTEQDGNEKRDGQYILPKLV
jgi:hypothetical protein